MSVWMKARSLLLWLVVIILLGLILLVIYFFDCKLVQHFWYWASKIHQGKESGSATIRNLGLTILAIIALPLAIWRSIVAYRQADAAHRQADIAQQSLLNQQYQRGAEMLESDFLSVRLGGINVLRRLANQHPEEYHLDVMSLFCSFARDPNRSKGHGIRQKSDQNQGQEAEGKVDEHVSPTRLREDVQAIMEAIGNRNQKQRSVEIYHRFSMHLEDADLRGLKLRNVELSAVSCDSNEVDGCEIHLDRANISGAVFNRVVLSGQSVSMEYVDMSGAEIIDGNMSGAFLNNAILSNAKLIRTRIIGTKLDDAVLEGTKFRDVDLTGASLNRAILQNVRCYSGVNLSNAQLSEAKLSCADLRGADVQGAYFPDAKFPSTIFSRGGDMKIKNLEQWQLDQADHNLPSAPILTGLISNTGDPLRW